METQIKKELNRREFIGAAAAALFAGIAVTLVGCDDGTLGATDTNVNEPGAPILPDAPGTTPSKQTANAGAVSATADRTGTVGANHPAPGDHVAIITGATLDAGGAFVLHIMGNAAHDHTVSLTAQQMSDIKAGVMVSQLSSSTLAHTHTVTFAAVTAIIPRHV